MPGRAGCCWGASGSTGESPVLALCCPARQPAEALSHFLRGDLTRSQHEEGRPPARSQQFRSLQILIPGLLLRADGRSAPAAASPSHGCRQLRGWSGLVGRVPSALMALASCRWPTEAGVLAAMAAIPHRAVLARRHLSPEAEEGAGVESHCLHPSFVPQTPPVTLHLSLSLQLASPPLPATWLQCPGISMGCGHVCLSLKTITTVLSPANTGLVTCATIQSVSLIKTVAHPHSH